MVPKLRTFSVGKNWHFINHLPTFYVLTQLVHSYFNILFRNMAKIKWISYPILYIEHLDGKVMFVFPENLFIFIFLGMSKLEKLFLHISIWNLQKQCGIPVSVWNWKLLVFCQVDFRLTCAFWRILLNFWITWDY